LNIYFKAQLLSVLNRRHPQDNAIIPFLLKFCC